MRITAFLLLLSLTTGSVPSAEAGICSTINSIFGGKPSTTAWDEGRIAQYRAQVEATPASGLFWYKLYRSQRMSALGYYDFVYTPTRTLRLVVVSEVGNANLSKLTKAVKKLLNMNSQKPGFDKIEEVFITSSPSSTNGLSISEDGKSVEISADGVGSLVTSL